MDAPARSAELGSWLLGELQERELAYAREVRGAGLMVGVELRGRVTPVIQGLQERGVLALVAGKTVLRLLPPLIITPEELRRAVDAVDEVLNHVSA
jgi:acetylornithine/LysW-gamma-L-lysine aminotransferase